MHMANEIPFPDWETLGIKRGYVRMSGEIPGRRIAGRIFRLR
jgi:hypothetical protein